MTPWADEFFKLAVNTKDLAGIVQRTGAITPHLRTLFKSPGETLLGAAKVNLQGGGGATLRKGQARKIERALGAEVPDFIRRFNDRHGGKIFVGSPKTIAKRMKKRFGHAPERSAGKSALRDVVTAHESAERKVRPRQFDVNFAINRGHGNMDVLMQERNLVGNLTGPGAREASRTIKRVRARTGETKELRDALVARYGPRAQQFMQTGRKIPKAMRKDMLRPQFGHYS